MVERSLRRLNWQYSQAEHHAKAATVAPGGLSIITVCRSLELCIDSLGIAVMEGWTAIMANSLLHLL